MSAEYIDALVCGYPSPERERRPLVIIQGFYDDSGSDRRSPAFVLAGVIASSERWKRFSDEWAPALVEYPSIEYLKMSEAHSLTGEFERWPAPLRDQKVLRLAEIVEKHALIFIESTLDRSDFDAHIKGATDAPLKMFNDPYFLCFYYLVVNVAELHRDFFNVDAEFIFDDQGKIGDVAASWWTIAKAAISPDLRRYLLSKPSFKSDRKVLPLQAADLYAWHARNSLLPSSDKSIRTSAVMAVMKSVQRKVVRFKKDDLALLSEALVAIEDAYRAMTKSRS